MAKSAGVIYAFPAHSNEVLCIDTNVRDDGGGDDDKDESWRVSTIPIHRHENDMDSPDLQYKWRKFFWSITCCLICFDGSIPSFCSALTPTHTICTFIFV